MILHRIGLLRAMQRDEIGGYFIPAAHIQKSANYLNTLPQEKSTRQGGKWDTTIWALRSSL